MKITKNFLKRIIKEELEEVSKPRTLGQPGYNPQNEPFVGDEQPDISSEVDRFVNMFKQQSRDPNNVKNALDGLIQNLQMLLGD